MRNKALDRLIGDLYANVKRTYAILMLLKQLGDDGRLDACSEDVCGLDKVADDLVHAFISVAAELEMGPGALKSASAKLKAIDDRLDEIDEMFRVEAEGAARQN